MIKLKEISSVKEILNKEKESLPLSFKKIVVKEKKNNSINNSKSVNSLYYKDDDYQIFHYYKSITQF